MKRVIKFWNRYQSDAMGFSDSSTEYEVLPYLVPDDAGPKELRAIAKKLGVTMVGRVKTIKPKNSWSRHPNIMTHAIKLDEKTEPMFYEKKVFDWHLGFVTLSTDSILEPLVIPNGIITEDQGREIVDSRAYGVDDVGEFDAGPDKDNEVRVIMSGWEYFSEMRLLGYDHDQFQELMGASKDSDGRDFYDSVTRCDDCGIWDSTDNGYKYNHRMTDDGHFGINCGCFHEYGKKNFLDYGNESKKALELEIAEELKKEGKLKFVERFIGGMTDGRGGWYAGKPTREGSPESVLKELQEKNPKGIFLFTHDESGQFQTYFSVWEVTKKGMQKPKRRAA